MASAKMQRAGEKLISIARDFSRDPGPRFKDQGVHSGEAFRALLVSLLDQYERVIVDLDGTSGIGSSFIDEAFGGLIFAEKMTLAEVRRRVVVKSAQDESYRFDFEEAIEQAELSPHG